MNLRNRFKSVRSIVDYTVIEAILLIVVFLMAISYIYQVAENDGYEYLHVETKEIKDQISLQIISDRENLQTMANLAAKLYKDGEDYSLLFNSFKAIGLIENIGILNPDNRFETKMGSIDATGILSFQEEALKETYVSGLEEDITRPGEKVVRSSVPIVVGEKTVGMLYGVMEIDSFKLKYKMQADNKSSQLYIIDRETGDFIIDTWHNNLENITILKDRKYNKDFTYEKISGDILEGKSGYSSFESKVFEGIAYVHYSPMDIKGWQIMLIKSEDTVFSNAHTIGNIFSVAFLLITLIMVAYIILMFNTERKNSALNLYSSEIRKLLLTVNQQIDVIKSALEKITIFSRSRSAFFVDTEGEDYNYILNKHKNYLLKGDDREFFVLTLLNYAGKYKKEKNISINAYTIYADTELERENYKFYELLKKNNISSIVYTAFSDKKNYASMLGVINPKKNSYVGKLLKDIAVCFSMAIYNKKYLNKTEETAVTDSLTGLANRTAYKRYIESEAALHCENLACIYVDVNELHIVNNKYGHAAGDAMLVYIADVLKEEFEKGLIYRIGGDEYLVFIENTDDDRLYDIVNNVLRRVEEMNYHISIGVEIHSENDDIETLVKKAEKKMYDAKAEYYQYKERRSISEQQMMEYDHISTGISELDITLKLLTMHYHGIYKVSLNEDFAVRILMPAYLKPFVESNNKYSDVFSYYVHRVVNPDYHRAMFNFLKYDVIKKQLEEGHTPSITYEKVGGEKMVLSIFQVPGENKETNETIWIFEKAE